MPYKTFVKTVLSRNGWATLFFIYREQLLFKTVTNKSQILINTEV